MRLSICIPTYNRADCIADLLDSIIAQDGYECELEIVISDNASTDDTRAVVERYRERLGRLVYHRAPENMGADRNFLKVVELASGTFCWLMGDDDILEQDAVAKISRALSEHPNIAGLTVNRYAYTVDLQERLVERPVLGGALPQSTMLTGAERTFGTLGEYFGFISGQVVSRNLWQEVVAQHDLTEYLNAYIHVYIIGRMLQKCPSWYFLHEKCVGWRSGNDSFMSEGLYKRIMIDVMGFEKISRDLFGKNSFAYHRLNRTVGSVHVKYAIAGAKTGRLPASFFWKITPVLMKRYWRYTSFWTKTVPVLAVPAHAIIGARWVYRRTLKPLRQRHVR